MASVDIVKTSRSRGAPFMRDDRVSVAKDFFDSDLLKYSEEVPERYERIAGTVQFVFGNSISVTWDLEGDTSTIKFVDAIKEPKDLPKQQIEQSNR